MTVHGTAPTRRGGCQPRRWGLTAALSLLALLLSLPPVFERPVPSRRAAARLLPAPAELSIPELPNFRDDHPRLPNPSASDIQRLRSENPGYLPRLARAARAGRGPLRAVVVTERASPGTQNLDLLFARLMALAPKGRGHEQVKPLAVAYDWLYDEWSPEQRRQLTRKLLKGCNYLIGVIRETRVLSPYNVYLYNQPFQALMACAIATYREVPEAGPVMAFTHDLWWHLVLPVWQQVMGRNGGWHEGAEYVGIGIGTAVYTVPAMWRAATGEDLFGREPGLRGFLDFLVYRTRPDGDTLHWGDGSYFRREVPDRLPLAIEYRHAAAYSLLARAPRHLVPTAWPWGPLSDASLYDPEAVRHMPLSRLFDGIGLLVARSNWGPDATYLAFKAGDHYWSHSHLDQGAFTLYKGGALAIDSGLNYGPRYGSDHHLNYSTQAIAHNTITVTDPRDDVSLPPKRSGDPPRPIANDGGQRRVGSGWGRRAPIDLHEWQARREALHTGTLLETYQGDGLTIAVADLTPAYTNRRSGTGTFADRTRRVEGLQRTVGYDRIADVIVVFDRVKASDPDFRKRWLLHTLERPDRTKGGFRVRVPPGHGIGHAGGQLEARVLLPRDHQLRRVGGRGHEFEVGGRNYDEGGRLAQRARPRGTRIGHTEPGRWRVELSPRYPARTDRFLVVLIPRLSGQASGLDVRLLQRGEAFGCEISAPNRTTRWWFPEGRAGVSVEVSDAKERRRVTDVTAPRPPAPEGPPWWARLW